MSTFGESINLDPNFGVGNLNLDEFNGLTAPTVLGQIMTHKIKWDNKPAALEKIKESFISINYLNFEISVIPKITVIFKLLNPKRCTLKA